MPKLFYLASPYSDPSLHIRIERFDAICFAAGKLMNAGIHVWSPIAHSHPIAMAVNLPKDFEFWRSHNFETLRRCDGILICMMPGWEKSIGVAGEIDEAKRLGIRIHYIDWPNLTEWIDQKKEALIDQSIHMNDVKPLIK